MPELKWEERRLKGARLRWEDRWLCPPVPSGTFAFQEPSAKSKTYLHHHLVPRDLATRPSLTPAKVGGETKWGGRQSGHQLPQKVASELGLATWTGR